MQFDENILLQIDKVIPYHILFLLEYEGKYQVWIGYKEIDDKKIKVSQYYHTQWLDEKAFHVKWKAWIWVVYMKTLYGKLQVMN